MNERQRRRPDGSVNVWSGDRPLMAAETDLEDNHDNHGGSSLHGDRGNIAILVFLYLLQGLPMGLSAAIPMIMQNRGASYKQQAEFSFANWPFSLKLLWAPIVDSYYSRRFGRRKSWLVPAQYVIGLFMLFLGANVDSWLGEDASEDDPTKMVKQPNAGMLTIMFIILSFLAATQDIAVDGWALTMLKRSNVGHASTCNSVGQTAGYFFGYVIFMALHSPEICNTYLRSEPLPYGMVTISSFLYWWGWVFLVTTTLVAIFKKEDAAVNSGHEANMGIKKAYGQLWEIACLPSVFTLALILLTAKIGFSASDSVTSLKLVDAGVPKEKLAFLAFLLVPLQIVLPLAISKYTTGTRPMDLYLKVIPYRLFLNLVIAALVYVTPSFIKDGNVPLIYYAIVLVIYCLHQTVLNCMFVAVMAFFARVSDPTVGGTYMTLLNTVTNMGTTWPGTLSLCLVESLTSKKCIGATSELVDDTCAGETEVEACTSAGGTCQVQVDGYYVEVAICTVIGCLWLLLARPLIVSLQARNLSAWKVQNVRRSRR